MLKSIANSCYELRGRPNFFLDLLVLAQPQCCPALLSGDGNELLVALKEFLIDYLRNVRTGLQGHFKNAMVSVYMIILTFLQLKFCVQAVMGTGGQSPLRHTLLEAYYEVEFR